MRAALGAHESAAACAFADGAARLPYPNAALQLAMSESLTACKRTADAL